MPVYWLQSGSVALALAVALATATAASDVPTSIWLDPARSATAASADGVQRSASTAEDLSMQEAPRAPAVEHWDQARQRALQDKAWAGWVAQQRKRVDDWMAAGVEHGDLVGGWGHDYIDPANGARLVWTPQTPRPPTGAEGSAAQRLERAWVAYMREYNITRMLDAARLYQLLERTEYAEWAASQLDLYAANYRRWPLRAKVGLGRMFTHGLGEATNVFALLDAARLLAGYAAPQRAERWKQDLFYPIAQNLKTVTPPSIGNIALWQAAGIAAVAMRYGDAPLLADARNGAFGITEILRQGVTRDNLWLEGTFTYNAYVLDALDRLLIAAAVEGQSATFKAEVALARRLLFAPLDYRFEDGLLPTPGDGNVGFQARPNWLYAKLYRSVPTAYGQSLAVSVRTWETLVDPPTTSAPVAPPAPPVMSRLFAANRMAVLKAGSWQAFVRYGQLVVNHAQFEALNYELADGVTKLSSSAGTSSYAAKQHLDYFTQAVAHNVPLIDGEGQADIPASADLVRFAAAEDSLQVSFPRYRPGVMVERAWRVTAHGFAERTGFFMQPAAGAARLGSAFHTTCRVATGTLQKSSNPLGPPPNKATKFWTDVQEYSAGKQWRVALQCPGNRGYELVVNGPPEQRVIVASAPNTPLPATRTVVYFDSLATSAVFELAVGRLGTQPQ